jgi:hypothetical protein
MITRRGFLGLLGAALAHQAAKPIYILPPLGGWGISQGVWSYRYVYRNSITGHVSNATPEIARLVHTFAYPELDVIDYYRHMEGGSFELSETVIP